LGEGEEGNWGASMGLQLSAPRAGEIKACQDLARPNKQVRP